MVTEKLREAVRPAATPDTVKVKVPATVGDPESCPLLDDDEKVTPGGSTPDTDIWAFALKPIP
jgi:hypothetical protein